MVDANIDQPVICYKYETVRGTKVIIAAATATETFGIFLNSDSIKIQMPNIVAIKGEDQAERASDSKEVKDSEPVLMVPSFELPSHVPTWLNLLRLLFGDMVDDTPDYVQVLHTGIKDTITLHLEQNGGTNEMVRDLVGCFVTELDIKMERNKPMKFTRTKFEPMSIEDLVKYAANISVKLTTTPTIREDGEPFIGIYEFMYDVDSLNVQLYPIEVELFYKNIVSEESVSPFNPTTWRRYVYPSDFGQHKGSMVIVLKDEELYKDLCGKTKVNCTCRVNKKDTAKYVKYYLNNMHITKISDPIPLKGGHSIVLASFTFDDTKADIVDGVNFGSAYNE